MRGAQRRSLRLRSRAHRGTRAHQERPRLPGQSSTDVTVTSLQDSAGSAGVRGTVPPLGCGYHRLAGESSALGGRLRNEREAVACAPVNMWITHQCHQEDAEK